MRLTDEGGDKRRRTSQGLPLIRPSVRTGAPSPHSGEGFGPAQIGRNSALCGTFGYIYWELRWSAPVGGRAARMCCPYRRGGGNLPPHPPPPGAPSPQGEGSEKTKRDRSGTCPLKHRGETKFRTKFLCLLSFSKKVSPGSEEPGLLGYFFSSGPLASQPRGFLMAAWAAASRAMGTRKGEQDT